MTLWPGSWASRHPVAADAGVWTVTAALCLSVNHPNPFLVPALALGPTGTVLVALTCRRWPPFALALALVMSQWDGRYYGVAALAALIEGRRDGALAHPLAWAGALTAPVVAAPLFGKSLTTLALELPAVVASAFLAGRHLRQRRELAAAGWERAARLERERELTAERARLRERARIAQEMHDSLGHELALLALRAAALEVAPDLDEDVRRRAAELRGGAAAATDRLHDIIGVLRDRGAPAPTAPVRASLGDLVAGSRASGLDVRLDVRPHHGPDACPLPPDIARAAHAIVQEALTNAAKHAPGERVDIRIEHHRDGTGVRIVNPLPPARRPPPPFHGGAPPPPAGRPSPSSRGAASPPPARAPGSRSGLRALRERAERLGGTFTAGGHGGTFTVEARLPHAPCACAAGPPGGGPPHAVESPSATQPEPS
jgi:signal transduction histidine kinase